jgi:hypothetical protein
LSIVQDTDTSDVIRQKINVYPAESDIDDSWQEFRDDAAEIRHTGILILQNKLEAAIVREERDRLIAERQAEIAAREQKERDERIAKEAAERAQKAAEQAAEVERRKQEALRIDAERRAAIAEQQAKDAAERERKQIELEQQQAQALIDARERDIKNRKRVRDEIFNDLWDITMDGGFSDEITEQLIHGKIRNIKVIY